MDFFLASELISDGQMWKSFRNIEYLYLLLLCSPLRKLGKFTLDKWNLALASIESISLSGYAGKVEKSSCKLTIESWLKVMESKQRLKMRIYLDNNDEIITLSERLQVSSCTSYLSMLKRINYFKSVTIL